MEGLTFSGRAPPLANLPSALESLFFLDITTKILDSACPVIKLQVNVNKRDPSAWRNSATLEASHARGLCRSLQILHGDVADLELRVGAVALTRGADKPSTLRNSHGCSTHPDCDQVLGDDISGNCGS